MNAIYPLKYGKEKVPKMNIAVIDARRHGKQQKFYILKTGASSDGVLPTGMFLGVDSEGREAILGNPSDAKWREIKREDFVSESIKRRLI